MPLTAHARTENGEKGQIAPRGYVFEWGERRDDINISTEKS